MQPYRSTQPGRDGFPQLLRAELVKLVTLRSTAWCVGLGVVLTILLSAVVVSSSKFYGDLPHPNDTFSFVHSAMSGDGSVVARVIAQDGSHAWAKAGVMIKESLTSGSRYAAMMKTSGHGVRLEADFTTSVPGSPGDGPYWLKLTRSADAITGYESSDGTTWKPVGTIRLDGLPNTVQVGLFVSSPLNIEYVQAGGATGIGVHPTVGRASFDHIGVEAGGAAPPTNWTFHAVAPTPRVGEPQPRPASGGMTEADGTFTVTGGGDIAWYGIPSFHRPDARDQVSDSLQGVQIGLLAMIVLGVLAAVGEYKTGMVRTTLAATPRRGRVLAAKAVVVGGAAFVVGLPASAAAFLIAQPILRDRGMRPPAFAYRSLFEGDVLRAVVGTAIFLALLAVFALAIGMIVRRPSRAIPLMITLVLVPQLVGGRLSLDADLWLHRLTPAAGLAIQQTVERFDTAIGPWAGLGVLATYAAIAFAVALGALHRRNA